MPFTDVTNDFKKILHERESSSTTPSDTKRAKIIKHSRNDDDTLALHKTYVAEAYNIVRSLILCADTIKTIYYYYFTKS